MAYHLEGRLLEVCDCRVLCPCWIGEDPDYGTCDTIVAWHFDKGTIDGVDVSGRTLALFAHVPATSCRATGLPRSISTTSASRGAEEGAARGVHRQAGRAGRRSGQACRRGRLGRERADDLRRRGRQRNDRRSATPATPSSTLQGRLGGTTTLTDTIFSTVPGAPVFVGKAKATGRRTTPSSASTSTSRATTRCRAPSSSTPERACRQHGGARCATLAESSRRPCGASPRATSPGRAASRPRRVGAWLALWAWSASPWARYLDHGGWLDLGRRSPRSAGRSRPAIARLPARCTRWPGC